ncbi:MAG: trigger factor [Oscillospiraceae bacterium]|nr:trigger factor [Oscillospiraceae bacterium]
MEIIKHEKAQNTVTAEFKVDGETFEKAVEAAYHRKKNGIMVPGFRKGKATRKMIERQYGESVFFEDAVNGMYQKAIADVIDELKLDVVDVPDIEVLSVDKDEGVLFKAEFTIKPEVSIKGYLGLEIEENIKEVTEDDIMGRLKEMQLRGARILDVDDRPAQMNDTVVFDFKGFCDDVAFQGGEAKNFSLELGSGRFIPGFEEQICGKNIGEDFDVNVTFPEDYQAPDLAGKPALFKCKINSIKGREMVEIDDEFAKDVSEYDTLDELKAEIRTKLEEAAKAQSEEDGENILSEKIVELVEADIPPIMFENRIDDLIRDWEIKNKQQQGMSVQMYMQYANQTIEQFREMFREIAEKQVKMRLALERISELENLEVEEEKVAAEYEKLSEFYKMDADKVRVLIDEESLKRDLKAEKALELVKENSKKVKGANA